jgi:hypothetical protein
MSFATVLALLAALLVAAPIAAHMLRRRRAEERPFPPARLVPPTPPTARRRSMLEDRALFAVRALAVIALAVLGATPFVRCSRLTLARKAGASVALAVIIDDSLSMRAPFGEASARSPRRFDRSVEAARELLQGLRPGDAVAVVLAGAPARVALASTTNMAAVSSAIDALEVSDRSTDLDGAVRLSQDLLKGMAQADKRIVLFSDLADGAPSAPPLAALGDMTMWAPLPELESARSDCAVIRADRSGRKVHVRVVCTPPLAGTTAEGPGNPESVGSAQAAPLESLAPLASKGRSIEVRSGATVVQSSPLAARARIEDVTLELPAEAPDSLFVALTGEDAITEDDRAPVVAAGGALPIAIVVDVATTHVATGGPPPIEQAFAALELDAQARPLPAVPEHEGDLNTYAALIVDDAPGFTPEVRRAIAAWIERGGALLLLLGPRAAAAPLGASFDPLIPGVVRWAASPSPGIDLKSAAFVGPSAEGFADLSPRGRAVISPEALDGADVLARWADGAPFMIRRPMGRGAVMALTLPLSTEESDLVLRPAFLALLDRFVSTASARGGARRIDAGETWTFDGFKQVSVERVSYDGPGERRSIPVSSSDGRLRASPPLAGLYELTLEGEKTTRAVAVPEREIDLRPRRIHSSARTEALGGVSSAVDVSPYVALALLALLAAELLLRTSGQRLGQASVGPAAGDASPAPREPG